jgi:hypothetical protein
VTLERITIALHALACLACLAACYAYATLSSAALAATWAAIAAMWGGSVGAQIAFIAEDRWRAQAKTRQEAHP